MKDQPPVMQTIAEEVGFDTAHTLVVAYGGLTVHVPAQADPSHPLAHDLGLEPLEHLCGILGGQAIQVPQKRHALLIRQRRKARTLNEKGMPIKEIAEILEVTDRKAQALVDGKE